MNNDPLQFINAEVKVGLQRLVCLRLESTPAADVLALTGRIWIDTMRKLPIDWNEELDKGRITASFDLLIRQSARWPAIKHLIDNLPKRAKLPALPPPIITPAQRKEGKQKINEIRQTIVQKLVQQEHDGRQARKALEQAIQLNRSKP